MIVPVTPTEAPECETLSIVVETGETFDRDYLFEEVFDGFTVLAIVEVPHKDYTDEAEQTALIERYEADPEKFIEGAYEISKVYH